LLDEKRCKFHANIVNITQWRGNPLCVVTPSHAIGGTIIDIFVCTSPEYFYTFRIEYFVQNTTSSTLEKLIPPVTEELLQTVRLQVPPKSGKLFYTSDRLLSLFFNGINSLRGLRSLEGDAIVEALFFSYTPMLPFLFNLATMYIPYDIV